MYTVYVYIYNMAFFNQESTIKMEWSEALRHGDQQTMRIGSAKEHHLPFVYHHSFDSNRVKGHNKSHRGVHQVPPWQKSNESHSYGVRGPPQSSIYHGKPIMKLPESYVHHHSEPNLVQIPMVGNFGTHASPFPMPNSLPYLPEEYQIRNDTSFRGVNPRSPESFPSGSRTPRSPRALITLVSGNQGSKHVRKQEPSRDDHRKRKKSATDKSQLTALERLHEIQQDWVWTFTRTGVSHKPIFRCTTQFKGHTFHGEGPQKQAAKQEVAEKLLDFLLHGSIPEPDITNTSEETSVAVLTEKDQLFEAVDEAMDRSHLQNMQETIDDNIDGAIKSLNNLQIEHSDVWLFPMDFYRSLRTSRKLYLSQVNNICRLMCALLNSQDGKIILKSKGPVTAKALDEWRNKMHDKLRSFIGDHILNQCVNVNQDESSLHLIVTKSPRLVTYQSHLYIRMAHGTQMASESEMIAATIKQDTVPHRGLFVLQHQECHYGDRIHQIENKNLEFKYFGSISGIRKLKLRLRDRDMTPVEKCILGFLNSPGGGDLILGVEEDVQHGCCVIRGQVFNIEESEKLKDVIRTLMLQGSSGEPRIWKEETYIPQEDRDWRVQFIQVDGAPNHQERYLICISVNQFQGGVFASRPECLHITGGVIELMPFSEWRRHIITTHWIGSDHTEVTFHQAPPFVSLTDAMEESEPPLFVESQMEREGFYTGLTYMDIASYEDEERNFQVSSIEEAVDTTNANISDTSQISRVFQTCEVNPEREIGPSTSRINRFVVTLAKLIYTEYCFEVPIFHVNRESRKYDDILKITSALLNTCGGIMKLVNLQQIDFKEMFLSNLQSQWRKFIPENVIGSCIEFHIKGEECVILMKQSPIFVTYRSGLSYISSFSGIRKANTIEEIRSILCKTPGSNLEGLGNLTEVLYHSALPLFKPGKKVQTVMFRRNHLKPLEVQIQESSLLRHLMALPNTTEGGYLCIGVGNNQSPIVEGVELGSHEENIFTETVFKMLSDIQRIWTDINYKPTKGLDWDIHYISVVGCPLDKRRILIIIEMRQCPNGVFKHAPEAYKVMDFGNIEQVSFEEWKQAQTASVSSPICRYRVARMREIEEEIQSKSSDFHVKCYALVNFVQQPSFYSKSSSHVVVSFIKEKSKFLSNSSELLTFSFSDSVDAGQSFDILIIANNGCVISVSVIGSIKDIESRNTDKVSRILSKVRERKMCILQKTNHFRIAHQRSSGMSFFVEVFVFGEEEGEYVHLVPNNRDTEVIRSFFNSNNQQLFNAVQNLCQDVAE